MCQLLESYNRRGESTDLCVVVPDELRLENELNALTFDYSIWEMALALPLPTVLLGDPFAFVS